MEWQRFETECGAPLWFLYWPHVRNCSVGVMVNCGSRDEKWPEEAGLAHVLEHMFCARCLKTAGDMDALIDDVGGVTNATTDEELTFYFHKITAGEVGRSIEVLGKSLLSSHFPRQKMARQMDVVIHEINEEMDDPGQFMTRVWMQKRFRRHPLSHVPGGFKRSVKKFSHRDLIRFSARFYGPQNFTFFVAGNQDPHLVLELFNRHFPATHSTLENRRMDCPAPPAESESFVLRRPGIAEAYIFSGALIGKGSDKDTGVLSLFGAMLDGGPSFPFFQEVREKYGYCYWTRTSVEHNSDVSVFCFMTVTSTALCERELDLIFRIIDRSKRDEKLLMRAKRMMRGRLDLIDDTWQMLNHGSHAAMIFGKPETPRETADRLESVTISAVECAVDRYLRRENFFTGMLLPGRK